MKIITEYDLEEMVYRKMDPDNQPGLITKFEVNAGGTITYAVAFADALIWCHDFELSREKSFNI